MCSYSAIAASHKKVIPKFSGSSQNTTYLQLDSAHTKIELGGGGVGHHLYAMSKPREMSSAQAHFSGSDLELWPP